MTEDITDTSVPFGAIRRIQTKRRIQASCVRCVYRTKEKFVNALWEYKAREARDSKGVT
jgi:hypothetical protein